MMWECCLLERNLIGTSLLMKFQSAMMNTEAKGEKEPMIWHCFAY
jgi:hypothetical protein